MNPILDIIGPIDDKCGNLDILPDISFVIDGFELKLTPEEYVIKNDKKFYFECEIGLQAYNLGFSGEVIILGDVFLQNYYTYYNTEKMVIGLAKAKK